MNVRATTVSLFYLVTITVRFFLFFLEHNNLPHILEKGETLMHSYRYSDYIFMNPQKNLSNQQLMSTIAYYLLLIVVL